MTIALMPLSPTLHVGALQHLYRATPTYWQRHQYATVPAGQAANDMRTAAATPGRYLMGVVQATATDTATDTATVTATATTGDRAQRNHSEGAGRDTGAEKDAKIGGELVGLIDFRLDWPVAGAAHLGLIMIAERHQRQGLGTAAWHLLRPWLAGQAQMQKVQLSVEQFNPEALQFFEQLGFALTGEANRLKVGNRLVRMLGMARQL